MLHLDMKLKKTRVADLPYKATPVDIKAKMKGVEKKMSGNG
jgi:hypothetical protein